MMAYTISQAIKSKMFTKIFCVTDSYKYMQIALHYGANIFPLRPRYTSQDKSSDDMGELGNNIVKKNITFEYFSILRPTSPFRSMSMIKKSFEYLKKIKHMIQLEL